MSRTRVWTFIAYPDSLPENWETMLQEGERIVPTVVSPLHDQDVNEDGTPKKPHHHIMVLFSQVKSYSQVRDLYLPFSGQTVAHKFKVDRVHSTQAMTRYFLHLDDKKKAQYEKADIKAFNGADVDRLLEMNDREIHQKIKTMIELIQSEEIEEFSDFIDKVIECEPDWFPLATTKYCMFLKSYITSRRHKNNPVSS